MTLQIKPHSVILFQGNSITDAVAAGRLLAPITRTGWGMDIPN